jgi:hypothetical protein
MENSLKFEDISCGKAVEIAKQNKCLLELCHIQFKLHNNESLDQTQLQIVKKLSLGTKPRAIQLKIAHVVSEIDQHINRTKFNSTYKYAREVPKTSNLSSFRIKNMPTQQISTVFEEKYEFKSSKSGETEFKSNKDISPSRQKKLCAGWGLILSDMYLEAKQMYESLQNSIKGKQGHVQNTINDLINGRSVTESQLKQTDSQHLKSVLNLEETATTHGKERSYQLNPFIQKVFKDLIEVAPFVMPQGSPAAMPTTPQKGPQSSPFNRQKQLDPFLEVKQTYSTTATEKIIKEALDQFSPKLKMAKIPLPNKSQLRTSLNKLLEGNPEAMIMYEEAMNFMFTEYSNTINQVNETTESIYQLMDMIDTPEETRIKITNILNTRNAINDSIDCMNWKQSDKAVCVESSRANDMILKLLLPSLKQKLGEEAVSKVIMDSGEVVHSLQIDDVIDQAVKNVVRMYQEFLGDSQSEIAKLLNLEIIQKTEMFSKVMNGFQNVIGNPFGKDDGSGVHISDEDDVPLANRDQYSRLSGQFVNTMMDASDEMYSLTPQNENNYVIRNDTNSRTFMERFFDRLWDYCTAENVIKMTLGLFVFVCVLYMFGLYAPLLFMTSMVKKGLRKQDSDVFDRVDAISRMEEIRAAVSKDMIAQSVVRTPRDFFVHKQNVEKTLEQKIDTVKIARANLEKTRREIEAERDKFFDTRNEETALFRRQENIESLKSQYRDMIKQYNERSAEVYALNNKISLSALNDLLVWDELNMIEGHTFNATTYHITENFSAISGIRDILKNTSEILIKKYVDEKSQEELESLLGGSVWSKFFGSSTEIDEAIDELLSSDSKLKEYILNARVNQNVKSNSQIYEDIKSFLKNVITKGAQIKKIQSLFPSLTEEERESIEYMRDLSKLENIISYKTGTYENAKEKIEKTQKEFMETREKYLEAVKERVALQKLNSKINSVIQIARKLRAASFFTNAAIGATVQSTLRSDYKFFQAYIMSKETELSSLFKFGTRFRSLMEHLSLGEMVTNTMCMIFQTPLEIFDSLGNGIQSFLLSAWSLAESTGEAVSYDILSIFGRVGKTIGVMLTHDLSLFKWTHLLGLSSNLALCLLIGRTIVSALENGAITITDKLYQWKISMEAKQGEAPSIFFRMYSRFVGTPPEFDKKGKRVSSGTGLGRVITVLNITGKVLDKCHDMNFIVGMAIVTGMTTSFLCWAFPVAAYWLSSFFGSPNIKTNLLDSVNFGILWKFSLSAFIYYNAWVPYLNMKIERENKKLGLTENDKRYVKPYWSIYPLLAYTMKSVYVPLYAYYALGSKKEETDTGTQIETRSLVRDTYDLGLRKARLYGLYFLSSFMLRSTVEAQSVDNNLAVTEFNAYLTTLEQETLTKSGRYTPTDEEIQQFVFANPFNTWRAQDVMKKRSMAIWYKRFKSFEEWKEKMAEKNREILDFMMKLGLHVMISYLADVSVSGALEAYEKQHPSKDWLLQQEVYEEPEKAISDSEAEKQLEVQRGNSIQAFMALTEPQYLAKLANMDKVVEHLKDNALEEGYIDALAATELDPIIQQQFVELTSAFDTTFKKLDIKTKIEELNKQLYREL